MITAIRSMLKSTVSHKHALRYRVTNVRFRQDGLPYKLDAWNLAKDCGVEIGKAGTSWFAELPKSILGIRIGTTRVDFGNVPEEKAFLAAVLATRKGRRVLAKSIK